MYSLISPKPHPTQPNLLHPIPYTNKSIEDSSCKDLMLEWGGGLPIQSIGELQLTKRGGLAPRSYKIETLPREERGERFTENTEAVPILSMLFTTLYSTI